MATKAKSVAPLDVTDDVVLADSFTVILPRDKALSIAPSHVAPQLIFSDPKLSQRNVFLAESRVAGAALVAPWPTQWRLQQRRIVHW